MNITAIETVGIFKNIPPMVILKGETSLRMYRGEMRAHWTTAVFLNGWTDAVLSCAWLQINPINASPLGGLCGAASVAEHEEETEITIDVSLRWRMEAIKTDYFVTPAVEFRLEDPYAMTYKQRRGSRACSP